MSRPTPPLPRGSRRAPRRRSGGSRRRSPAPTPPGSPWAAAGWKQEARGRGAARTGRQNGGRQGRVGGHPPGSDPRRGVGGGRDPATYGAEGRGSAGLRAGLEGAGGRRGEGRAEQVGAAGVGRRVGRRLPLQGATSTEHRHSHHPRAPLRSLRDPGPGRLHAGGAEGAPRAAPGPHLEAAGARPAMGPRRR